MHCSCGGEYQTIKQDELITTHKQKQYNLFDDRDINILICNQCRELHPVLSTYLDLNLHLLFLDKSKSILDKYYPIIQFFWIGNNFMLGLLFASIFLFPSLAPALSYSVMIVAVFFFIAIIPFTIKIISYNILLKNRPHVDIKVKQ